MAQFQGEWVSNSSETPEGFDAFFDGIGLGQAKEKFRNATSKVSYDVQGNKIKISTSISFSPDVMTYEVEDGKEFDGPGLDGSRSKITMKIVSDCEIHEVEKSNYEDGQWREFNIHRKVNGDVMEVTMTAVKQNLTLKDIMKRQK